MREIKFRAWDTYKKELWYADKETYFVDDIPLNDVFKSDRHIWMQFTGLYDKNGKEIYEGDILKDGKRQCGHVLWANNSYLIEWMERDSEGHLTYDKMTDDCFGYGEIIGNIYENPELLENN